MNIFKRYTKWKKIASNILTNKEVSNPIIGYYHNSKVLTDLYIKINLKTGKRKYKYKEVK